jgi:predicted PurR-regulated permease PerM
MGAAVLYFAREVLIPLALAILLTFLLAPLVRRLERLRLPRLPAVLVIVALAVGLIVSVGLLVEGEVLDFASNLPKYRENIREKLTALRNPGSAIFGSTGDSIAQISKEISNAVPEETEGGVPVVPDEPLKVTVVDSPDPPLTYARSLLGPILSNVATVGIVIAFTIFICSALFFASFPISGRGWPRFSRSPWPSRSSRAGRSPCWSLA